MLNIKHFEMNKQKKIAAIFLITIIISQVACEYNSKEKQKVEKAKQASEFKTNVIKKSQTEKKLFLDFWTGMSLEEYKIIEKELVDKSVLIDPRTKANKFVSRRLIIHLQNDHSYSTYLDPDFEDKSLLSVSLKFVAKDTERYSGHIDYAYYPSIKVTPFDKDVLLKFYSGKYGKYKYKGPYGGSILGIVGKSNRKVSPSYHFESYLFEDYENKRYIKIEIKIGDKYNNSKILGQFVSSCTITYISFVSYKNLKSIEKEMKNKENRENRKSIDDTKNHL